MCPSIKLRMSRLFAMMVRKPQPVCQSNSALCAAVSSGSCTCAQGPLPRPACRHIEIITDIIVRRMFDDMFVYESGLRRRDGRRPLCIRMPKTIKEAETLRCRRQLEGGILCSRYCMLKVRSCGRGVCTMPPSRVRVFSFFRGGPGWDLVVGAFHDMFVH